MAFENLTNRLQDAFKRLRGKGKVTEADVNEAMREVRLALLEADVNFVKLIQLLGIPVRLYGHIIISNRRL